MNTLPKSVAVLDACVLFPAPIRDFLLHLASVDLYQPKWTAKIQEEWTRNLLIKRPDIQDNQLSRTVKEMDRAFPDANVTHFESLNLSLALPDPGDLHVVAASIQCKAEIIVTFNLKDFPKRLLNPFNIEAKHPDSFTVDLIDQNPEKVLEAFENQVKYLKNPPKTASEVVATLEKCGLKETCEWLKMMI